MKPVLVFAPSENFLAEPSFRLRVAAIVEPMARRGFELVIRPRPKSPWGRIALACSARKFHAVILHRKMLDPYEARMLRRWLPRPRRIFMDIDDAVMLHETSLGRIAKRRLDRRFAATVKILDTACAGNDYLAQFFSARGIKSRIVPTVVDPVDYHVKRHAQTDALRLVWIGSRSTLKYLEERMPTLSNCADTVHQLRLLVICDAPPSIAMPIASSSSHGNLITREFRCQNLPIDFIPWSLETESAALALGDIGIAPLPENPWTLGKCGFKIIQYMATGLPTIASPVGMQKQLVNPPHASAAGILAADPASWRSAIETLAADPALRETVGTAGRRRIEAELNLEKIADIWAEELG